MFTQKIICSKDIRLIKPDIERDASLAVKWFGGENGIKTLRLLGNILFFSYMQQWKFLGKIGYLIPMTELGSVGEIIKSTPP